ncbi:MAG TPA: DUF1549 and DUF1553 domain-containing protein [Pirellulales bacterium]|nr:DUF1549 and DUF1553 domain-containing protein [Pirellulales bacterium]
MLRLRVAVVALLLLGCLVGPGITRADDYDRSHWAFQARGTSPPPTLSEPADQAWLHNEIDAFVLARLKLAGLPPAFEADRRTLIRRLYFDLIGLPPTPAEIEAYVGDPSPSAYETLVDRLLASPHYGERWGRHWLDVVRYAETEGFEYDRYLSGAWRYRDWVIESLNADKPYDRFVREQLAGDEMTPADPALLVAAGFLRLGPVRRNAGNQEVAGSRNEVLTEMTNAVGSVFLGLTVGCARCHDHMFDPVLQSDYYRLEAFLAATHEHDVPLASDNEQAAWRERTEAVKADIQRVTRELEKLKQNSSGDRSDLQAQLVRLEAQLPPPLDAICSVADDAAKRTAIHVLERGNWDKPGRPVGPRVPGVFLPEGAPELSPNLPNPRTSLADWLLEPNHPLAARVIVNRVWQYHFGHGIVATPNDFGVNGDSPSHPELLDWLATRFIADGWRLKELHRLIVTSATYRQASRSANTAQGMQTDPADRLLWHFPRRRLEAEEIRDAMLSAAGRLNLRAGGPSVVVPVESDLVELLYKPSQWQVTAERGEHDRRSVYLIAKRNLRLPFMEVFDQPDLQISCACREASTHAPQALELLNGKLSNELADALADRLAREAPGNARDQIDLAYRLVAGRPPNDGEAALAAEFLAHQPLREFALAMFNVNAFLYVE